MIDVFFHVVVVVWFCVGQLPGWERRHGVPRSFIVRYWEASTDTKINLPEVYTRTAMLSGLKKGTQYMFEVKAFNDHSGGHFSDAGMATTDVTGKNGRDGGGGG